MLTTSLQALPLQLPLVHIWSLTKLIFPATGTSMVPELLHQSRDLRIHYDLNQEHPVD